MSRFLVIPRMRIEHANAMQAWWLMSIPSPMTGYGFAVALALKLKKPTLYPKQVAIAYHQVHWLAQEKPSVRYIQKKEGGREDKNWDVMFLNRKVVPQQPQGATFIDEQDTIASGFAKSLQPTARCHVVLSVVVDIGDDAAVSLDDVHDFLWSGRIGGGSIVEHGPVKICHSSEEVTQKIGGGFWMVDRSDQVLRVMQSSGLDGTEAITQILGENARQKYLFRKASKENKKIMEKPEAWLSVNTVGYAALEEFKIRTGVRIGKQGEIFPHAYAEPIAGLIAYKPVRNEIVIPFWRYHNDPAQGVYFMKGE